MFKFLFFNITFERLFLLTIAFLSFLIILNISYWAYYFYKKKKNSRSNFERIRNRQLTPPSKLKKYLSNRTLFLIFTFLGIGISFYALHIMFNTRPVLLLATPENNSTWTNLSEPIVFEFDRPINTKKLNFKMVPEVEGEFRYPKSIKNLPFTRRVEFYPKTNFEPGTRVYLLVGGFYSLVGNHERYAHEANIETGELPEIAAPPENVTGEVLLDDSFKFNFNTNPSEYVDIDFEFEPYIEFDKKQNGGEFVITPKTPLLQSSNYKLRVLRSYRIINLNTKEIISKSSPENLKELSFSTVKAPENKAFSPSGNAVFVDSEVKFEFSQPMNPESVLSNLIITPELKFSPEWSDNNKVLILKKEKNLEFDKEYTVTLKSGTLGRSNTVLEKNLEYKFKTIGTAKVARTAPGNGSTGQGLQTQIKITFDQEVDKNSAQSKFSISPEVKGSFVWENTTMIFKPTENYKYDTKYTYTVAAGVKSLKGQDTKNSYSNNFTTISQKFTLNVPVYKQKYRFSCNLTAASMVLAFKGINRSQDDIYAAIPKDSTQRDKEAGIWGDPDAGYVGQLNGPDGYGIHWGPIANYLNSQGVSASVKRGMSASALAKEVEAGRPAIVWVWNTVSGPSWEHWTTPSGKKVDGLVGMHSYVVVGFVGSADNPTSMIINDPWGNRNTLTTARFNYLWSFYGNTVVVVQ